MDTRPVISTVILNWNRADLLELTCKSYLETVSVPCEIIIVDNGSTDGSREVAERMSAAEENISTILLDENRGGAAINLGLERATGTLLHISENDLEYLPGWSEKVVDLFDTFESLGQLSLYGPVPDDEEVWSLKLSDLMHRKGRIIYQALNNVGTSCILRRELWDRGLRVTNLPEVSGVLFPNDQKLSDDIKAMGMMVAWCDHYLVRNHGHTVSEFESREDYYRANYRAKPWVGESGWEERVRESILQQKPVRASFLLDGERISPERTPQSELVPRPRLWSMLDGKTPEIEALEFLYALTRMIKPDYVVETSAWLGHSAAAIGRALAQNNNGRLVALEPDEECFEVAAGRIHDRSLDGFVEVVAEPGWKYAPGAGIDFLLLDSEYLFHVREFRHLCPRLKPGCIVAICDAGSRRGKSFQSYSELAKEFPLPGFFLPSPRGMALCRYTGAPGKT